MKTPLIDNDLASLRQEVTDLRAEMAMLRSKVLSTHSGVDVLTDPVLTDRRGMMKKVAGLAVGVATVGLLRPGTSRAGTDAISADGGAMVIGADNTGTVRTRLRQATLTLATSQLEVQNYGNVLVAVPTERSGVFGAANTAGTTDVNSAICGVYGRAVTAGTGLASGVIGIGTDRGVVGSSADAGGLGGEFTGIRAAIRLITGAGSVADPNVTPPAGNSFGDLYRSATRSALWYNTGGNEYRRLADNGTAGALTVFPASSRFVNLALLNAGATAAYQIGGTTVGANTVPAKARVIIGRIADAAPTGGGGAILVAGINPPGAGTGVLVVTAGAPQNSSFISALDATGQLFVRNTSPSGSVQIVIDIAGYYE